MQNVKLAKGLVGQPPWHRLGVLSVAGDPGAAKLPPDANEQDKEAVIQSWQQVAVLRVVAEGPVRLGFIANGHAEFLAEPISTADGLFGVHLGPHDTTFVVWPESPNPTSLELVARTEVSDPTYPDLPLY